MSEAKTRGSACSQAQLAVHLCAILNIIIIFVITMFFVNFYREKMLN